MAISVCDMPQSRSVLIRAVVSLMRVLYAMSHSLSMPNRIIRTCIVSAMKPNELLAALLIKEGLSVNRLATKVGRPGLQSQIQKFKTGGVVEPGRSTVEPLAAYFGIPSDAFYKAKVATAIAKERGLPQPPPEATLPAERGRKRRAVGDELEQIAARLVVMSQADREKLLRLVDNGLVKPRKQIVNGA